MPLFVIRICNAALIIESLKLGVPLHFFKGIHSSSPMTDRLTPA
jgi:hypothetical protein